MSKSSWILGAATGLSLASIGISSVALIQAHGTDQTKAMNRLAESIQTLAQKSNTVDDSSLTTRIHTEVGQAMQAAGVDDASLDKRILANLRKLAEKSAADTGHATDDDATDGAQGITKPVDEIRPVDAKRDHVSGPADAPVSLIVYDDFECPFCRRHNETLHQIRKAYPDNLNIVIRDFPLAMHGQTAKDEAIVGECVARTAGDKTYWQYVDALFEQTRGNGRGLPSNAMPRLLTSIGADPKAVAKCQTEQRDEVIAKINADMSEAERIGVRGTPGNVLYNHKTGEAVRIDGARPFSQFKAPIDDMIQAAGS